MEPPLSPNREVAVEEEIRAYGHPYRIERNRRLVHPAILQMRVEYLSYVYPLIGVFVLASAGLIEAEWTSGTGKTGMWVLTGLFTLGSPANFASRSKTERFWGPVSLAIAVCCGITAMTI